MTEHLIETRTDGIATLTMNRPEARNAMSGEMMAALSEALPRLAADQSSLGEGSFETRTFRKVERFSQAGLL